MQVARLFLSRSLHQASAELAPRSDSFGKGSKQILPRLPVDSFTVHRKRMSTRTQAKDQGVGESVTSGVAVQAQAVDCGQPKEPGTVHLARQASSSNAFSVRPSNEGPEPGL